MNSIKLFSVLMLGASLAACGGSGGGTSTSSASSSANSSQSSVPANSAIKFGYFLDSAVANIGYRTDSLEGMTSADGSFQYLEGETLEFFIGDLVFPSVRARATVTPLNLAGTSDAGDPMVINIARLLQSLDVDGNPANGIIIGEQAAGVATSIDFDQSVSAFAQDTAVINLVANSGSTQTTLISEADALAHLQATLSTSVNDRVVVSADGSGNTYELFDQRLGGTAVESPVCDYQTDSFGRRITDIFDETLDTHVFAFHILRDVDGDRCIETITDRQRIEIKTYGPSPAKLKGTRGEIHTYRWKFKLDEGFQPSNSFTHIFQIKASGGNDDGPPILTLSPRSGNPERMEVIHTASAGFNSGPHVRASADLSDFKGEWIDAYVRAYYEEQGRVEVILRRVSDGQELLSWSHNNQDMWRDGAGFNRPKWGIYRSLNNINMLRDETVLFNDFCIAEGTNTCPSNVDDSEPSPPTSSSSSSSSSASSSAPSAGAQFDFESDTLGAAPSGFIANGPVVVSNEQARSGSQSVKFSHPIDQAVNLRGQFEPANTGSLKASIYIQEGVGVDSFISVYAESFAGAQRAIDIIFRPDGKLRRREGASNQVEITSYAFDEWHDVELHWNNLSVSNEFTLMLNGVELGSFVSTNPGLVPTRVEFKFGQNNAAVSEGNIFIDEVSVF